MAWQAEYRASRISDEPTPLFAEPRLNSSSRLHGIGAQLATLSFQKDGLPQAWPHCIVPAAPCRQHFLKHLVAYGRCEASSGAWLAARPRPCSTRRQAPASGQGLCQYTPLLSRVTQRATTAPLVYPAGTRSSLLLIQPLPPWPRRAGVGGSTRRGSRRVPSNPSSTICTQLPYRLQKPDVTSSLLARGS